MVVQKKRAKHFLGLRQLGRRTWSLRLLGFLMAVLLLLLKACGGRGGFSSLEALPPPTLPSPTVAPVPQFTIDVRFPDSSLTSQPTSHCPQRGLEVAGDHHRGSAGSAAYHHPGRRVRCGVSQHPLDFPIDDLLVEVAGEKPGQRADFRGSRSLFCAGLHGLLSTPLLCSTAKTSRLWKSGGICPSPPCMSWAMPLAFCPVSGIPRG
jgi:hypothetical protein